ncbi:MAG: hypothetical protein HC830_14780 [Bacteroidetes bacterium]|nr:hypothetical protein [Bacteroidota bacterium]
MAEKRLEYLTGNIANTPLFHNNANGGSKAYMANQPGFPIIGFFKTTAYY